MELTALDVAKYFLFLMDEGKGDLMSNLTLQKLVYYAQGFYLAIYDKPLFTDVINVNHSGPFVPNVFYEFEEFGTSQIPFPNEFRLKLYTKKIRNHLNEVNESFGQFSGWKLTSISCEEPPVKKARNSSDKIITHDDMKEYFKTQIFDE